MSSTRHTATHLYWSMPHISGYNKQSLRAHIHTQCSDGSWKCTSAVGCRYRRCVVKLMHMNDLNIVPSNTYLCPIHRAPAVGIILTDAYFHIISKPFAYRMTKGQSWNTCGLCGGVDIGATHCSMRCVKMQMEPDQCPSER